MSVRDIIDAIESGDSAVVQTSFESEISSRIAERLDTMKQAVAQNMFKEAASCGSKKSMKEEEVEEEVQSEEVEQESE